MSIKINNLSKYYGQQKALNNINLEINSNEVVGLLGPNGAGKSTLMKIITCFIPPSKGSVSVNGMDIIDNSIDIRKQIGYLPENNPLYPDMYIKEYLFFVAGIHNIENPKKRIQEIIELTGLTIEQNKKIRFLSKGYKQRVGIAQALIHDPKVLILDEPTSGLDPNQLSDIRNLIRTIGKEKTVLLSTHIMQEVEAMCSRVIIIKKGAVVADDATGNISKIFGEKNIITVEFDTPLNELKPNIEGLLHTKKISSTKWIVESSTKKDIRPELFKYAIDKNLTIISLNKETNTLEQVFQRLTK
ncbi:MAG: gliding motility-associated ABC transporter ATP-binding subunit GldA [Bacteroidota bacterium]|nr:gliding motility-associated ABC transporter ATP-binding subunit GldA [Bacteroidota bacterium]